MPNMSFAVAVSIILHLALGTLVLLSVDFSSLALPEELQLNQAIIEATMVDEKVIREQINRIKEQKDAVRKQEEKRVKDIDAQRKKKLLDKKKAEQAAVAAREKRKKAQERAKKLKQEKVEKERKRKEAEDKAKRAKEQREKEENALKIAERKRQDALEKTAQEKLLAEQLQSEQAARQQQQRSKQVLSEVQKYQVLITQTIQRNWITDDSMKGKFCRLNIRLASSGFVINVKELGGDAIVCRSAKAAILRSGTLPVSKEADVYHELKDINLTIGPEL